MCLKHLCTDSDWYLKIVQRVDHNIQTSHSVLARNCKISKSKNAVILSKMIFSSKREVHILCMPVTFVRSFRLIA